MALCPVSSWICMLLFVSFVVLAIMKFPFMKPNLLFSIVLKAVKMSPFSNYKFDIAISLTPCAYLCNRSFPITRVASFLSESRISILYLKNHLCWPLVIVINIAFYLSAADAHLGTLSSERWMSFCIHSVLITFLLENENQFYYLQRLKSGFSRKDTS